MRSVLLASLLIFMLLLIPSYYLLLPIYAHLGTARFFFTYLSCIFTLMVILIIYNRITLRSIFDSIDKSSFVFSLDPSELIYLKRISDYVVHMRINKMISDKKLEVDKNKNIVAVKGAEPEDPAEYLVLAKLGDRPAEYTNKLIRYFRSQPAFSNAENTMKAFRKYFWKSRAFGNLLLCKPRCRNVDFASRIHQASDRDNARQACRCINSVFDLPSDPTDDHCWHNVHATCFNHGTRALRNEERKISV